jgi:hypothetical protein
MLCIFMVKALKNLGQSTGARAARFWPSWNQKDPSALLAVWTGTPKNHAQKA